MFKNSNKAGIENDFVNWLAADDTTFDNSNMNAGDVIVVQGSDNNAYMFYVEVDGDGDNDLSGGVGTEEIALVAVLTSVDTNNLGTTNFVL